VLGAVESLAEALGVAVFALTGALVAARRGMDPFGFALLATATGIGGGTVRDLLLGVRPVFWVAEPRDVIICVIVAGATYALGPARVAWIEGGGIIRDLLAGTVPLLLRREIYVTAAALGAAVVAAANSAGLSFGLAGGLGFTAAFALRALALLRGWSLPAFPARD
jgi:uncharacterized membrane protein YeiH